MNNTITKQTTKELARAYLAAAALNAHNGDCVYATRRGALKTPKGRISKACKELIKQAEKTWSESANALLVAEDAFLKSLCDDKLAVADRTRDYTIKSLRNLFGGRDVTKLWADANAYYHSIRKSATNRDDNGYLNGSIVVLDVTPDSDAFKNVITYNPYGNNSKKNNDLGDVHCHLWVCLNEFGEISRARLFNGKVAVQDPAKPKSNYLDDGFGINVERSNAISISTFNGNTSELKAWGLTLLLASEIIEKIQPLLEKIRGYDDNLAIAKEIVSQ